MTIYFYEVVMKLEVGNKVHYFMSNFEDFRIAYLNYCVSHQLVPGEIVAHEQWASLTNNRYRRSCADQSCEVDFVIRSKEITKV